MTQSKTQFINELVARSIARNWSNVPDIGYPPVICERCWEHDAESDEAVDTFDMELCLDCYTDLTLEKADDEGDRQLQDILESR